MSPMRPVRTYLAGSLIGLVSLFPGCAASDEQLVLIHVTVIDATGAAPQPDMIVVLQGQHIAALGKSVSTKVPRNARVIDASGQFVIPGLWDMHVHEIFGDWLPRDEKVTPLLFVANGVTGVRDMGGDLAALDEWRSAIAARKMIGPRIIASGPMLDGPVPQFPSSAPIKDAADGRRIVADLKNRGADFIKIQSLVPRAGYFAAAEESKRLGIVFAGHVPDAVRAVEAVNAGQKSIEHLTGVFEGCSNVEDELMRAPRGPGRGRFLSTYDPARAEALIALFASRKTWQTPTLYWERGEWLIEQTTSGPDPLSKYAPAAWKNRAWPRFTEGIIKTWSTDPVSDRERFFEKELELVGKMNRAGVPILAGTDTAAGVRVYPGFSLHDELELLVRAGLTPMQALQSATRNAAQYLEIPDAGTVENGKRADLVLLDANPLDSIRNTRRIQSVVLAGWYFSRTDLDALLHEVEAAAASSK